MGNRAQIWPGPECLRTDPVLDVLGRCGALARTITIALAHERARARMARFVAWLVENGACSPGLAFAKRYRSPEQAVMERARKCRYCSFIYNTVDETMARQRWRQRWLESDDVAVARRLVASPEWASLPWQRDPGVAHG